MILLKEMDDCLGIGLAEERNPLGGKLFFECLIIFYNAVVDDIAVLSHMGVGIELGWLAVGRPAGVPDGGAEAFRMVVSGLFPQVGQFADGFEILERFSLYYGNSCRVVSAIFQVLQSIQKDLFFLFFPNVSDDAAHMLLR